MSSMPPGTPTSYFTYEYAQPFQPLGQPAPPPPYNASGPWSMSMPMSPSSPSPPQPAPPVKFIVGSPQTDGLHRTQSLNNFSPSYSSNTSSYRGRHGRSHSRRPAHASRKHSRHELRQSYSAPGPIPFPEPQIYPPHLCGPPPPYPGVTNAPPPPGKANYAARPSNPPGPVALATDTIAESRYGISGDEISIQPEHCTFLVDAVKEMDLCSRIFSAWVEQAERSGLGKNDKEEANIVSMIVNLADDALKMVTASRNILSSYKALARLMDRRLSKIARSQRGGDLFSPNMTPSQAQAHDDFQTLATDVHIHSAEISACVDKMQDRLHELHDTVLRKHEKYSVRKKIWGCLVRLFRFLAQALFLGGAITALVHPVGVIESAAMHVTSGFSTILASICEKVRESYDDEEKGLSEVLKMLQGKIPKSMRVAQTALEKFQAAHIVFRQHHRVSSGRSSGYISPGEAAKARSKWHKAADLLELKDKDTLHLNIDSMAW
ncbi:hypothetical protein A7U60_g3717 [Sanghuangporus baumii]|uniref:Uncharacterized protein n=1 Tax=Sanghuangporus baumii TaxID=108892 RepID=A0A9Q5N9P8_SANBA|nr:hypothetical protein A7U60_g3717 [Sanghuangporus baumii]